MKRFLFLILFGLVLFGCNGSSDTILSGSWYYVDPSDSSYNEMYFTKEFLIPNLSSAGVTGVYSYMISEDSVYLTNGMEFSFKIIENKEDQIIISNSAENEIILEKLELPRESFTVFCLPENRKVELQQGRIFRGTETLLNKGLMEPDVEGADSILYIPAPEN